MFSLWQIAFNTVVGYIVYRIVKWIKAYKAYRDVFNACPGENDFSWITGDIHTYPGHNEKGLAYERELPKKFPKFNRMWVGPFVPLIVLYHPDTVRKLMTISVPKARGNKLATVYDMVLPWLGEGLLISNGDQWARNRRLLTAGFHFNVLRPYANIYNDAVEVFMNKMMPYVKRGESYEMFEPVSLLTLDIIIRCAFSHESHCQEGEDMEYVTAVKELLDLWTERSVKPWLLLDCVYKRTASGRKFKKHCDYVHKVSEELIEKRRKAIETNGASARDGKHLDFLDILLTAKDENGDGLSPMEIRSEADTFLFEGHDTTASGVAWTLYSLAQHPEYQRRVQQEVDDVLQGRDSPFIHCDDLPNLVFLGQCIKESMRLHTPVVFLQRKLEEDLELEGHTIPASTLVAVQLYILHHNPLVWDDPMAFKPERFSLENSKDRDPFAFIPFSAGPRNCIGQNFAMHEMKIVIARILQRFTIRLDPNFKVKQVPRAVLKSEEGIKIFAELRNP